MGARQAGGMQAQGAPPVSMQVQQTGARLADALSEPAVTFPTSASTPGKRGSGAYPAHVVGSWRAANGTIAHIRPVAAADGDLIRDFVRSLSFETRYMRFMSSVTELSAQTIDRLTRIDHRRDAALIAIVTWGSADRVVGVVRYALNPDGESCEFAIVVADEWQGRGLGRRLLSLLVDTAAARGLKRVVGEVLAINHPMLTFVKALGFCIRACKMDQTIRRVDLPLT